LNGSRCCSESGGTNVDSLVTFTRQTNELLKSLGYNLKYEELPEWGHALTYSINERLVMPWFESLPPREEPESA